MSRVPLFFMALLIATAYFFRGECDSSFHQEMFKYFTPLTLDEQEGIHYIVTTLSTKPTIALFRYRRQLEEAGTKTMGLHPLRFWKEVLSNDELKSGLPNIGPIPKRQLLGGFVDTFDEAFSMGEMRAEYIEDFCRSTGIDEELFYFYSEQEQWRELLEQFFLSPLERLRQ